MRLLTPILLLAGLVTAQIDFSGTGQIRTLWTIGDHADLGCLTSEGKWTSNNSSCGTFSGERSSNGTVFKVSTSAGGCGIEVATFKCGDEVDAAFGVGPQSLFYLLPYHT
jgi:hypothetical protein